MSRRVGLERDQRGPVRVLRGRLLFLPGCFHFSCLLGVELSQRAFHPSGLALNPASFSVCTAAFGPIWVPLLGLLDVNMDVGVGVLLRLLPPLMLAFTFLAAGVRPSPFVQPFHGREHSTCHQE